MPSRIFTVHPNGPKLLKFEYPFSLSDALQRMPNLHTVSFVKHMDNPGLLWCVLSALLSTPHRRSRRA
ncbi:hypothetical protein C8Q80DRAFT_1133461 [Daedaleopsis nitida]|nr:hypothetical protein C8Q80DRAFT_1133461 [Daedaleopsis nitida]